MEGMAVSYRVRRAEVEDAVVLARQRVMMFRDMGLTTELEGEAIFAMSVPWFEGILRDGSYVGWLTVAEGEAVAGAGVHLREMGPVPGIVRVGRWGHIANEYTDPVHRGRGLARGMMREILEWGEREAIDRLTLTASEDGEALYRSLGFAPSGDMQLLLRR